MKKKFECFMVKSPKSSNIDLERILRGCCGDIWGLGFLWGVVRFFVVFVVFLWCYFFKINTKSFLLWLITFLD